MVFDAARQEVYQVTSNNFPSSLRLCLMDEDHYDVVYKREHIVTAGFCQCSLITYKYKGIFLNLILSSNCLHNTVRKSVQYSECRRNCKEYAL